MRGDIVRRNFQNSLEINILNLCILLSVLTFKGGTLTVSRTGLLIVLEIRGIGKNFKSTFL